ncbi:hypothetical protein [Candidatus Clostridium helianthi]|jgi:hypothetical protein|uniref:Uncharacterized protein n=1 Tax=Candidatus Clostridium helianthi TaxID=3381660 RepID=A0ABW8RZH5_9CLOT
MKKKVQAFIIKEENNMIREYGFKLKYRQQTAYEIIDGLYEWLLKTAKDTYNQLKGDCYDDFGEYYGEVIKDLSQKGQAIKTNKMLGNLNIDSTNRLKYIVQTTKEEYYTIIDLPDEEKDFVYFNSLLGWYEAIPSETDMFIESLHNKQGEEEWVHLVSSTNLHEQVISRVVFKNDIYTPIVFDDGSANNIPNCNDCQKIAMVS